MTIGYSNLFLLSLNESVFMKKLRAISFEKAKEEQRAYFLSLSYAERIAALEKLRRKILGPSPAVRSKKIEIIFYKG
jgi:hypothetical protein